MAKKKKLTEDQLVNEMPPTEQPVPATQSEITKAAAEADVAPNAVSAPFDPLKPPVPGMIPTGWANPEDLAASLAMETGDVVVAQTAEDATVVPAPEPVVEETPEAEPTEAVEETEDDDVEIIESVRGKTMRRERMGKRVMPKAELKKPLHEAEEEMDVDSILADTDTDEVLEDVVDVDDEVEADPENLDIDELLATIPDALEDLVAGVESEVDEFKAEVGMEDEPADEEVDEDEAPEVTEEDINDAAAEFDAEEELAEKRKARAKAMQEARRRRNVAFLRESRRPSREERIKAINRRIEEHRASKASSEKAMRERALRVARIKSRNKMAEKSEDRKVVKTVRVMNESRRPERPSRPVARRVLSPMEEKAVRARRASLAEAREARKVERPVRKAEIRESKGVRKLPVERKAEPRKIERPARAPRPMARPASRPVGAVEEKARQNRERMIQEARKQKMAKSQRINEGIKYPKGSEPKTEVKPVENLVESYEKKAMNRRANVNALSSKLSEKANPKFTEALKSAPVKMNETVDSKSWQANTFEEHYKESQKLNFEELFRTGHLG